MLILVTANIVTVQIVPSAALDPQQSGLSLTVASNLSFYNPGNAVSVTGTLLNNGASVPSALVSIQVSKPSGATLFVDMPTTNGAGYFSTAFTLSQSADLGTYTVYAVYSTASAQNTFRVLSAPLGLSLSVAASPSIRHPGNAVSVTGTLLNNGASVPSALVSIQVSKPSGATLFVDMPTTNGAGYFSTAFTLSQSADLGTYTVYAAYSTASVQNTFQVVTTPPPSGSYTITVNTNPSGLDSPQGGGTYTSGQQITISIGDVSGYTFIKWQRDGSDWTTQKSFQYTVDAPRTFTAIFQQIITTASSSTTSSTSSTSSTAQTTSTVATSSSSSSSSTTSSTSPTNTQTGLSMVLGSVYLTTTPGGTVSFPVTVSSLSPQPAQVALSMNGLQAAWQYTFSPQSGTANPTFVSTLTLTTSFAAPPGSYITTVRATDQSGHFVEGNAIIVVAQTTVTQVTTTTTPPTTTLSAKCIIATAAYGSEMAPEVVYMRYVRDNLIGSTPTGKVLRDAFNTFYYSWSPPIAQAIAGNAGLQALFRILLLPLVGIIHATAWVFIILGAGDLASIAAFTIAAALTITVYIVTPTFAILLTYKESKALLVSPSDST